MLRFLRNITPEQIQWRLGWSQFLEALLTYEVDDPVLLLYFTGCTSYYFLRVIRQFGTLHRIPPPRKLGLFEFELPHESISKKQIPHYQESQQKIVHVAELKEEMAVHCASMESIQQQKDLNKLIDENEDGLAKAE